jgi:hypothetical protein
MLPLRASTRTRPLPDQEPMRNPSAPLLAFLALTAGLLATPVTAQTPADSAAIRATALDYIVGWYEGDADRMARALHPELVKRIVQRPAGGDRLNDMSAEQLIQMTARKGAAPGASGRREVRILDVFGSSASVRVDADGWVDFMQMARWNGEWRIVNVLWEMR